MPPKEEGGGLMIGRILGKVVLGAFAAAVIYEVISKECPELVEKMKGWFEAEDDDFIEPEEAPALNN
jgi:hypothetical protein